MTRVLIEIAVDSLEGAQAAAAGGADRIELCAQLDVGGLTPPAQLTSQTLRAVNIPVFAMIRERPGSFVYQPAEIAAMCRTIDAMRALGVHGFVAGALTGSALIDVAATTDLLAAAAGLPFTFHRAFDRTADLPVALDELVALGVGRVLTSGGAASAPEGLPQLRALVERAAAHITILAGGGLREDNVARVVEHTGVREVHTRLHDGNAAPLTAARVRLFRAALSA